MRACELTKSCHITERGPSKTTNLAFSRAFNCWTSRARDMDVARWILKRVIGGLSCGRDVQREIGCRLVRPEG